MVSNAEYMGTHHISRGGEAFRSLEESKNKPDKPQETVKSWPPFLSKLLVLSDPMESRAMELNQRSPAPVSSPSSSPTPTPSPSPGTSRTSASRAPSTVSMSTRRPTFLTAASPRDLTGTL